MARKILRSISFTAMQDQIHGTAQGAPVTDAAAKGSRARVESEWLRSVHV